MHLWSDDRDGDRNVVGTWYVGWALFVLSEQLNHHPPGSSRRRGSITSRWDLMGEHEIVWEVYQLTLMGTSRETDNGNYRGWDEEEAVLFWFSLHRVTNWREWYLMLASSKLIGRNKLIRRRNGTQNGEFMRKRWNQREKSHKFLLYSSGRPLSSGSAIPCVTLYIATRALRV